MSDANLGYLLDRRNVDWEPEFENGDLWPRHRALARPTERRPIAMLTGLSGAAVGPVPTHVAFTAGVATTPVASLRAASNCSERRMWERGSPER